MGRSGLVHRIDGSAALKGQGQHQPAGAGRRQRALGEGAPLGMRDQHDLDRLAPDHGGTILTAELRVLAEAQRLVEGGGGAEVGHGEADEEGLGHAWLRGRVLLADGGGR